MRMTRTWATRVAVLLVCAVVSVLSLLPGCGGDRCQRKCAVIKSTCPEQLQENVDCEESCRGDECVLEAFGCLDELTEALSQCEIYACDEDVAVDVTACPIYLEYAKCYNTSYETKSEEELEQLQNECY